MFAILWGQDGSEGIAWYLRGKREAGTFYGEVRYQSSNERRCKAVNVSGQLTAGKCMRLAALVDVIRQAPMRVESQQHFTVLLERLDPTNFGTIGLQFNYCLGDESASPTACAFLELIGLVELHLSPYCAKLSASDL